MNKNDRLGIIREKPIINVRFLINDGYGEKVVKHKLKFNRLIDQMKKTNRFSISTQYYTVRNMIENYDDIDILIPLHDYIPSFNKDDYTKLKDDCKLVTLNYGFFWDIRQISNPLFDDALMNFYDHASYIELVKMYGKDTSNYYLTGNPFSEELLSDISKYNSPWKTSKKHVIIALHWTITNMWSNKSSLILFQDVIQRCIEKYDDKVEFIFKLHPDLIKIYHYGMIPKYLTDDAGRTLVETVKSILRNFERKCTFYEGDNVSLFKYSDALIQDCGSFRCEYLHVNKPCAYMFNDVNHSSRTWTRMGQDAIQCHTSIWSSDDFEDFIRDVISGNDILYPLRTKWLKKYIYPYPNNKTPSENIINAILGQEEFSE